MKAPSTEPQFLHKSGFLRFLSTGFLFTILDPFIFLFLVNFISPPLAILVGQPPLYAFKYILYKYWVFKSGSVTIIRYLCHVIPIYLASSAFVFLTNAYLHPAQMIGVVVVISAVSGYILGKIIYKIP